MALGQDVDTSFVERIEGRRAIVDMASSGRPPADDDRP
jgi:hypothetical protein